MSVKTFLRVLGICPCLGPLNLDYIKKHGSEFYVLDLRILLLSKQILNDLPIFFNTDFPYKLVSLPFTFSPTSKKKKKNPQQQQQKTFLLNLCERFES